MVTHAELYVTIACAIFASTGFWAFVTYLIQRHDAKESAESQVLKGLAHDRICTLAEEYLKQGYITQDQFKNIDEYLYQPYKRLGGNGTAEKVMKEVCALPLRSEKL